MKSVMGFIKSWAVPAVLVALAALLTVPWTFWVIAAAYERDVNEKCQLLANRIRTELSTSWYSNWVGTPQQMLNVLKNELLSDPTVQAVAYLRVPVNDNDQNLGYGYVSRSDAIPVPLSVDEIKRMLNADPNSYREYLSWPLSDRVRGVVYLDLSRSELKKHFRSAYGPLLRNVMALTATGIVIISAVGIFAYRLWGRAARQRQRAELEQQGLLAERGLTAAVLAHEIRNPLAALRFQLHSLRRNAADPARVGSSADTIDGELMRIQTLVQEYLEHEKAQALRVAPVALAEAAGSLQTLMSDLLRESETRLVVQGQVENVVVACDPHGLRQVLMNLVINAQQAMKRGGTISLRIGQSDGFGAISVSDTGPGIPEEMRERLFKPFATSKKDGHGIGLALVKRFADNFGGSVAVDSTPGKGATFTLRLPLMAAARPQGLDVIGGEYVQEAIT